MWRKSYRMYAQHMHKFGPCPQKRMEVRIKIKMRKMHTCFGGIKEDCNIRTAFFDATVHKSHWHETWKSLRMKRKISVQTSSFAFQDNDPDHLPTPSLPRKLLRSLASNISSNDEDGVEGSWGGWKMLEGSKKILSFKWSWWRSHEAWDLAS